MGIYVNELYKNRGGYVMGSLGRRKMVDGVVIIFLLVSVVYIFASPKGNVKNDSIVFEQKLKDEQEVINEEQLAMQEPLKQSVLEAEQKTIEEQKAIETEYIEKNSQSNGNYPVEESISVTNIETPIDEDDEQELIENRGIEEPVYIEMHEMINSKIVAIDDKIWGEITITPEVCEKLIVKIKSSDYDDKEMLLGFLNNWKKGSFKNGVSEHNYLWNKLNGDIGKAIALRSGVE